jgi:arylamine N-acetyltransferase
MTGARATADQLLDHLHLGREAPALAYLHRIIREHQLRVPFETLTKLIDYEPGFARGDFLPPIALYVERIVTRRAGGLCWTLARGLHFLLRNLGFDASFMYMDPGHCCVRVELPEGSFYADVGYAAPIFQAYPVFESFSLDTHREKFEYSVRADGIFVTRNPGPAKRLDPAPRRRDELEGLIAAANDWSAPQSFLHRLSYAAYPGGVYTSLRNGTLTRYLPDGAEKSEIAPADVPAALADIFGADPALYQEAAAVQRRFSPAAA